MKTLKRKHIPFFRTLSSELFAVIWLAWSGWGAPTSARADDAYEPNNSRSTAYDLRSHPRTWLSSLAGKGIQANDDWYRIAAGSSARRLRISCLFKHEEGDIDLYLYDASGSTTWVARSLSSTDNELIDVTVSGSGDYYLWVRMGNAGNAYDLWWEATTTSADDAYSPNHERSTAWDFSSTPGAWLSSRLGPGLSRKADWYQIVAPPDGELVAAQCTFLNASGNLNLRLYDAAGAVLTNSATTANTESISFITPVGGGTYYLEVYASVYTANSYDLLWTSTAPPPQPPASLSASDGTSASAIELSWPAGDYAKQYQIYRYTSASLANASLLATVDTPVYTDSAVTIGTVYYYWVRSVNTSGTSAFTTYDKGYRSPAAPSTVTATDGTYSDKIQIKCSSVSGATSFKLYRAATNDFSSAILIGSLTTSTRSYDDKTASLITEYFYWVRAICSGGDGLVTTVADRGYRAGSAPASVTATDGSFTSKVRITWTAVTSALRYDIFRGVSESSAVAIKIGSSPATTLTFDDSAGLSGQVYYYWIRGVASAGPGPLLDTARDTGWRLNPTSSSLSPVINAAFIVPSEDSTSVQLDNLAQSLPEPTEENTPSFRITWQGSPDSNYQVQGSSELSTEDWTNMGNLVQGTNCIQQIDIPITDSTHFFRLLRFSR